MKGSLAISLAAHALVLAILAAVYFLSDATPPEPQMVEVELQTATPPPPPPMPPPQPKSTPVPDQNVKPPEPVQPPVPPPVQQPAQPPAPPPSPPPATDDNIVPVPPTPQVQPSPQAPEPPPPEPTPPKPPAEKPPPPQPPAPPVPKAPPPAMRLGDDLSVGYIEENGKAASCKSKRNLYPVYPQAALQRGERGSVTLRLHIDSNGDVILVETLESSGYPLLDNAARDRLQTWHCDPASKDGAAALDLLDIQITFQPE